MEQAYKFHNYYIIYINCIKYCDIYRIVIFFQVIGDSSFCLVIHTPITEGTSQGDYVIFQRLL